MIETFKIFQVDASEAEKIIASENEPHYHDFEELIISTEGQLEHFIDFKSTVLHAPFVSFVTKGKVHRVKPIIKDGKCHMWVIRFKSEFIPETIFQLYSLYHDNASIELSENACFTRLDTLCEMMDEEIKQSSPDYAIIRQLLGTVFTMIESERRKLKPDNGDDQLSTQNITFKNFLAILEENFRRNVGVDYYAEKLFMSARNLNNICHHVLQQSVSEIIETRKLIEAKNLLSTTDKTVSEIGFELGYREKAYFTRVFKKRTGQTPTAFRTEMRSLIS
ncbi:helix-turn-helix domain-containing protein [Sphingobacterium sp. SGG-5]|uniref:helix-turn-helix domain-containing protein n=1 Tax=Sphingobacterium sp. SGG-5 TaxID=2710881 RepID=UPI0013EA0843|nr:helix-turn-helix transcriptional regulator [Sphingobacterium sp. SGG-5]NGM62344.1 helix-turn-helix domain-containing protein [Sphingobacterium sp. SGG-5]